VPFSGTVAVPFLIMPVGVIVSFADSRLREPVLGSSLPAPFLDLDSTKSTY
jgi:hypothetical protein